MCCPPEIAELLLAILQAGLLSSRARGASGDGRHCAVEADHLHNLPALLANYSDEPLRYYWDVERTAYISQSKKEEVAVFEEYWRRLGSIVNRKDVASLAS